MAATLRAADTTMRLDDHFEGRAADLAQAAAAGDVDAVRRLIREQRADPNSLSSQGMPLLLWPLHAGNLPGFAALLAGGADPNRRSTQGEILMHYVVESGGEAFVAAALAAGAKPNQSNRDREPLIHIAHRVGDWASVRALLAAGADVDAPGFGLQGNTLLGIVTGFGDFEHVYWLLEHGADPTLRITDPIAPEASGTQPILDEIFHRPVDPSVAPQAARWQQRCRELLLARGLSAPPVPRRLAF